MNLKKVATGEYWEGLKALELGLVDEISTSDEYLLELSKKYDIYEISYITKKKIQDRFGGFPSGIFKDLFISFEAYFNTNRYR